MATAAMAVTGNSRRPRRRTSQPRLVVEYGGRELDREQGQALRLSISSAYRLRQLQRRIDRSERDNESPERQSVATAMLAIEDRLVKAFDVLARSTRMPGPKRQEQHGVGYMMDPTDKWAGAVEGGGWLTQSPPPAPASANEVDASDQALDWLALLDRESAGVLSAGARSKRGDTGRRVNWIRVKAQYPELEKYTADRLKKMYDAALRFLASKVKV